MNYSADSMVRHNVYFWLDVSLSAEDKSRFEAGLQDLFSIKVIRNGSFGKPAATPERPVTQNTFDYSLFLEFDSVEDHNAYQVHPDHDVFVNTFSPWFKTVKVYDSEL